MTVLFSPTEFTEANEDETVALLTTIANVVDNEFPDVDLYTINHGTHQKPMPGRGVRFFDLPQFTPGNMGVKVHPLMFYDLERPAAGVYGNEDYKGLLSWTLEQQQHRRIIHYPESSWWLTFDLPVPLFFAPATVEARHHDINLLSPYLAKAEGQKTGIYGHRLFSSGQEWGYWVIDYCASQMAWSVTFDNKDCWHDIAQALVDPRDVDAFETVMAAVETRQIRDLRDPNLLRFLVGSDDGTEAAARTGIQFHPLPPAPSAVLGYTAKSAAALQTNSLAPLAAMAQDYETWAQKIAELRPNPATQDADMTAAFLYEFADALAVFSLRAAHAVAVYNTALKARDALALLTEQGMPSTTPALAPITQGLVLARALTGQARDVIRRREANYRYPPALTIVGGEPDSPDAKLNPTVYPYRYLSRTHRLFYWTRPDNQLAALVRQVRSLHKDPTLLVASEKPSLRIPHGNVRVESPEAARRIQGLLPGIEASLGDDGAPFIELRNLAASGFPIGEPWRSPWLGKNSVAADLPLPLGKLGKLWLRRAVVEMDAPKAHKALTIRGRLLVKEIVQLVMKAGFDQDGARVAVAMALDIPRPACPWTCRWCYGAKPRRLDVSFDALTP